jgi:hypothetical protein
MVGNQCPSKALSRCFKECRSQSENKVISVAVIAEDIPAFDDTAYNVVKRSCTINTNLTA